MKDEKRMARDYEITQSIRIGDKEIVLGVDEDSEQPYFCAYYESNDLLGRYYDCLMGADYAEMIGVYAQRIQEQGNRLKEERASVSVPNEKITAELCIPDDYKNSIAQGEKGYTPSGMHIEGKTAREAADISNDTLGVTRAQEAAMLAGSMFGWHTPAADPKNYDDKGQPIKPKQKDRGDAR